MILGPFEAVTEFPQKAPNALPEKRDALDKLAVLIMNRKINW